jgi:nucleotide-binding universal stress UspA family protein
MQTGGGEPRVQLANILAATDFSTASHAAAQYAISLARHYGATLYLVHIASPDASQPEVDEAWREGHRLTTDLLVSGHLRGIPHRLMVRQGDIWEGLAPVVRENAVDLIVVGTRGRSGLSKMLLGSVAERIFRQATCPVLTVGPNTTGPDFVRESNREPGLRRMLYATDFTAHSLHAAPYALSLALQYRAHLVVLHVIQETAADSPLQKGRLLDEAKCRLRELIPAGSNLEFEPEFIVGFGTPAARILDVAVEKVPDVIVLGVTHPLPSGVFAGRRWTTASEVAAKAACPVLTIRAT